jgi:MSHA biogenesis protein MshG
MPEFSYKARDEYGKSISGTLTAQSEDDLAGVLSQRGQYLIVARERGATTPLSEIRILESVTRKDLLFFTAQMATILHTQVPVIQGLQNLSVEIEKPVFRNLIESIRKDVAVGNSLADALGRHPKIFNEFYLNLVRAGEYTGKLDEAFDDLLAILEWQDEIRTNIRQIVTYPAVVFVAIIILNIVLVGFTIPAVERLYSGLNLKVPMPLPTRIVLGYSRFIGAYWPILLALLVIAAVFTYRYIKNPEGRLTWDRWKLRLPVVGPLLQRIAMARFAHYMGSLHRAGLELSRSLRTVAGIMGNAYLADKVTAAYQHVRTGESLSQSLGATGEFPPLVLQMVAIGETTGEMERSLGDVRRFYDREVNAGVKRALTMLGPILIAMLAMVLVMMASAFYLPLFQLLTAISSRG